ncbi:UDP-glucose 4-epimerase GalE [Pseudoclavibacter chungangensis]|uniref:UDP-glucose 4-epimerase n=1 Tax=Pseudoclavibacter chungangensis TaxID=587635 RepID=A0A7J5BQI8_9MICO|nr:UDP-glucose 4-epimerase GalE [Pseudoclavibacter chungangensis]KAB1653815.1 UDP-glucose 4-epimerase GalE [Pseudoclavibacter chungangensis]NYJ68177.1 UDP-glucose 4-epimerase [Pseudoclavibacter chungangensis]
MTRWLVTGGAGYIGAHVANALLGTGREVTVVDDLSTGATSFVPEGARLVEGSIGDAEVLHRAFADPVDGVVHLAGFKFAGVSVARPMHTYRQNVSGTIELLDAMHAAGVHRLVFSSSAGVYGTPDVARVTEQTPPAPESPYGESKLVGEWLIADARRAAALADEPFSAVSLRYFNVIGSGEPTIRDLSPHNLVPAVFRAIREGRRPRINGDDFPTPDGTCVRDYVHVADLALAHVAAAAALEADAPLDDVYNLGSGTGTSVRELLTAIAAVAGVPDDPEIGPRRAGDPASIVADGSRAAADLGWAMRWSLEDTIASAWRAERFADDA